jgi:hypothetical protein
MIEHVVIFNANGYTESIYPYLGGNRFNSITGETYLGDPTLVKVVKFDAEKQGLFLNSDGNISIQSNIERPHNDVPINVSVVKTVLAFLLKEGHIAVDDLTTFESKWNMNVDELYNKFEDAVNKTE